MKITKQELSALLSGLRLMQDDPDIFVARGYCNEFEPLDDDEIERLCAALPAAFELVDGDPEATIEAATLRDRADHLCQAQPGYGTPAYRGDPLEAVGLRQQADAIDPPAPTYAPPPEGTPLGVFSVRFLRSSLNSDAYRIDLRAASVEDAEAKFEAWARGEIELTDSEAETERHVKDYGIYDTHGDPEIEPGGETICEEEPEAA